MQRIDSRLLCHGLSPRSPNKTGSDKYTVGVRLSLSYCHHSVDSSRIKQMSEILERIISVFCIALFMCFGFVCIVFWLGVECGLYHSKRGRWMVMRSLIYYLLIKRRSVSR